MATEVTLAQGIPVVTTVTDRRVLRPDELFHLIGGPDNAPYYMMLSMLGFEGCYDERARWYYDEDFQSVVRMAAAATYNGTTFTLLGNDYKVLVKGQVLYCARTGEHMLVTATPSSAAVTVARNIGDTGGVALVVGDELFVSSAVQEESGGPVDTYSAEPFEEYNYIEMNRHGWKVSGRANAIELWGKAKLAHEEEKHTRKFMREREIKFLYNPRAKHTSGTEVRTLSGGIRTMNTLTGSRSLVRSFDGVGVTKGVFDATLRDYFAQASAGRNKVMLCGFNMVSIINGWLNAKLQVNDQATQSFGTRIFKYTSPFGDISLLPHKLWNTAAPQGFGIYDEAWIVDLDSLKRIGLKGRPTDVTMTVTAAGATELQANGYDYIWRELQVEDGLKVKGTENFAFLTGING